MGTHYRKYKGSMNELDSYLDNNKEQLNRLSFYSSGKWVDNKYIQYFSVDEYDEEIVFEYILNQTKLFFKRYKIEKEIGYWIGELLHEITELAKINNIPFGSVSLSTTNTCFCFSYWSNIRNANKIAKLFETDFNLRTKIEFIEKGYYKIYVHKDQSVLDELIINEKPLVKIEKKSHREALLLTQKHLQEELKKIEKQLKKSKK